MITQRSSCIKIQISTAVTSASSKYAVPCCRAACPAQRENAVSLTQNLSGLPLCSPRFNDSERADEAGHGLKFSPELEPWQQIETYSHTSLNTEFFIRQCEIREFSHIPKYFRTKNLN